MRVDVMAGGLPMRAVQELARDAKAAGFSGVDTAVCDAEEPFHYCAAIVSTKIEPGEKETTTRMTTTNETGLPPSGGPLQERRRRARAGPAAQGSPLVRLSPARSPLIPDGDRPSDRQPRHARSNNRDIDLFHNFASV